MLANLGERESRGEVLGDVRHHSRQCLPLGGVDAVHAQHPSDVERFGHATTRDHELELQDVALGRRPGAGDLLLDRAEMPERVLQRMRRHEPAESAPGVDKSLLAQDPQRPADGETAGGVRGGELRLAGEHMPAAKFPGIDPPAEILGDPLVGVASRHVHLTSLRELVILRR